MADAARHSEVNACVKWRRPGGWTGAPGSHCKENINSFTSALDPTLSSFDKSTNDLIVTGDFDINLLQVNMYNKEHYGDSLDLMLGHSLFPRIYTPNTDCGKQLLFDW